MNGAVHRLHCGVREERNLIDRLDLGDGVRHRPVDIADILRNRPRIKRRLSERARDIIRIELGVRTVVPFDRQRCQPFFCSAHMVGHDRNGIVEPHDLTHALDGLGRRIIHALQTTAEDGRLRERRELHPRRPGVDAIDRRSVDFRRRIQPLGRGANELEILRSLERHVFGDRHAGSIGGQCTIFVASARRHVKHFAALRAAGRRIDIPPPCRRRHEHGSCGRTGLAQGLPRPPYRVRVASRLQAADQGVAVKLFVGRTMFQPHLFQLHLELFGDQHRDGRIRPLAHLDIRHGQDDLPIAVDTDEGIRHEAIAAGRFGSAVGERQVHAQQQATANGRSRL